MRILQNPKTEPYGEVLKKDFLWAEKIIRKARFNPYKNRMEWTKTEPDKTRYISPFIFKSVPVGCCAICESEINSYKQKYYQWHYEDGFRFCFVYDAGHFCEDCAKKEAQKMFSIENVPVETDRFSSVKDSQVVETIIYADGSRLEDLTRREIARME